MRCILRYLHSPDAPELDSYAPDDPSNFGILIEAMIGPVDGDGEEAFSFVACTPIWLGRNVSDGYRWGRELLFLDRFDLVRIRSAVDKLCASIEGSDWEEIARKLSRFTAWEFDDYSPVVGTPLQ